MACPTCDHTMHSLRPTVFWCPRCGTVKHGQPNLGVDVPKIVGRIVAFCGTLTDDDQRIIDNMERLGVTEAATHPDVRL